MTVRLAQWTLDVQDVARMAEFWSQALGYSVREEDDGSAHLYPPADASGPTVWLQNSGEPTTSKNPCHPDLTAVGGDTDAEVARLIELGARPADVGQTGEEGFVVLTDPEGNEFCVLRRASRRQ